jgi:hypothetical protein
MLKTLKKWALVAAVFGGVLFNGGCLGFGGNWKIISAILNEDLFG